MEVMACDVIRFYNKYINKGSDIDKSSGLQCVDLFKIFCRDVFSTYWATPNGCADGYWMYKNRWTDKFDAITGYKNYRNGDWVIWMSGSSSCPLSHIGMYLDGKIFGMRQGDNRLACVKRIDVTCSAGALRWKG